MFGNDNGTDGQTDRQSATQYAAPREEGRIIMQNGYKETTAMYN